MYAISEDSQSIFKYKLLDPYTFFVASDPSGDLLAETLDNVNDFPAFLCPKHGGNITNIKEEISKRQQILDRDPQNANTSYFKEDITKLKNMLKITKTQESKEKVKN